jgi:hypothetical protein
MTLALPSQRKLRHARAMPESSPPSPLEELVLEVERSVRAASLSVERRLGPLESALAAYRRAYEAEAAREYALAHSLPVPVVSGAQRNAAARALRDAVLGLPELADTLPSSAAPHSESPTDDRTTRLPPSSSAPASPSPLGAVLPHVAAAAHERTLAILGSLAGRKRDLPDPLDARTEWIDTSQGGAHAVGNLPARIRQGRVFGIIVCESVISHKHTDPVIAAARAAGVPVGFAGKGGNAGIARALRAIEGQLRADSSPG